MLFHVKKRSFGKGFTLIELLVVILVMAVGLSLVVGRGGPGRDPAHVEALRLAALLEHAGMRARTTGMALAWQATGDGSGYGFRERDERWMDIGERNADLLRPRRLPEGIRLQLASSRPEADQPPSILLPTAGLSTRFSLILTSVNAAYEVRGDVAGRVVAVAQNPP